MQKDNKVVFFDLFDTLVKVDRGMLEPYFDRETDRLGDNGTLKNATQTINRLTKMHPQMLEKGSKQQLSEYYEKVMNDSLKNVSKDVLNMLQNLKDNGYRLCVISDAAFVDIAGWDKSPLSNYFDKTIFSCEVGYIKPEAELYEIAKQEMGHPQQSVFIGDGGHDELMGAQIAGMKTIKAEWINNRRMEEIYQFADLQIQETSNVLTAVKSLENTQEQDIDKFIESFSQDNEDKPSHSTNDVSMDIG